MLKLLRIGRVPALAEQLLRLSEQESISNDGPTTSRKGWLRGMHVDVPRWCVDVAQVRGATTSEGGVNLGGGLGY